MQTIDITTWLGRVGISQHITKTINFSGRNGIYKDGSLGVLETDLSIWAWIMLDNNEHLWSRLALDYYFNLRLFILFRSSTARNLLGRPEDSFGIYLPSCIKQIHHVTWHIHQWPDSLGTRVRISRNPENRHFSRFSLSKRVFLRAILLIFDSVQSRFIYPLSSINYRLYIDANKFWFRFNDMNIKAVLLENVLHYSKSFPKQSTDTKQSIISFRMSISWFYKIFNLKLRRLLTLSVIFSRSMCEFLLSMTSVPVIIKILSFRDIPL